jgi:hypothetical protein
MIIADFCARLGYYEACSVNYLQMSEDTLSVPSSTGKNPGFLNIEDGTDRISRNLARVLPVHAV